MLGDAATDQPRVPAAAVDRDPFATARSVADAVLYEGYLLYPYRRSSGKNRVRWQFGVVMPQPWIEAHGIPDPGVAGSAESWFQQVECLVEAPADATVRMQLRYLHLQHRQAYRLTADGERHAVDAIDAVDDGEHPALTFDEGVLREADVSLTLADLLATEHELPIEMAGRTFGEELPGGAAGVERTTNPLHARILASARPAVAPFPLVRLRVRIENTAAGDPAAPRELALRDSLVGSHLLLGLDGGRFVSLLDPPAWAGVAVESCDNRHLFPVLAGAEDRTAGGADVLLCSPIILYDHPKIAPESPGDLHDATEIDEILSLRTMTLTEAEKQEARATDARAAAILDRVDGLPAELLARLHGAVRDLHPAAPDPDELPWWDPRADAAVQPETDQILVAGSQVGRGSTVRLRPRGRGTDAHDMFLSGRTATVHAVLHDVDGSVRVAVTVDSDPAADLHEWYGRFFHFTPEEIEPIGVTR